MVGLMVHINIYVCSEKFSFGRISLKSGRSISFIATFVAERFELASFVGTGTRAESVGRSARRVGAAVATGCDTLSGFGQVCPTTNVLNLRELRGHRANKRSRRFMAQFTLT